MSPAARPSSPSVRFTRWSCGDDQGHEGNVEEPQVEELALEERHRGGGEPRLDGIEIEKMRRREADPDLGEQLVPARSPLGVFDHVQVVVEEAEPPGSA
jgi:hypothetical protein